MYFELATTAQCGTMARCIIMSCFSPPCGVPVQLQSNGPVYVFIALAVAVLLLSIGGTFYEEPLEDQSHYMTLGIKRMCKADEIKLAYEKLKTVRISLPTVCVSSRCLAAVTVVLT